MFKRDKQADGETEKFVSMAIDYCLSFGFILFWNAIDITAVSQRDNHHAAQKNPCTRLGNVITPLRNIANSDTEGVVGT